jgi:DNA polymerase-3 subunit delta
MMARAAGRRSTTAPVTISSKPLPIYVVFGAETFLKTQAIGRVIGVLLEPDQRATSLAEYEGGSVVLAELLDELRTLPFLAPRRVALVRDADTFISANREHLEKYLEMPSETGSLILECRSFPSNTRLYKRAQAVGQCIACESPRAYQVPDWLAERSRSAYGKQLDSEAARLLAEHIGETLGILDGELAKLSIYVGDRPRITSADVEALVGHQREQKVFGILGAMAEGNTGAAMRLWEEVWRTDRAAPGRAVGGMAYGVRQLLAAHEAVRQGGSVDQLARRFFTRPDRLAAQMRAFPPERLHRQLDDLCQADVNSKTGGGSVQSLMERFIVEHTSARR